ncbi:MAG: phage portal protein, partial [Hyphomonadaceae bacterium]|nr:phage portal protein [Hyphomonadaceae bacterium]
GSLIVPFPESTTTDVERLQRGFRGRRGSVLLRESVNVTAAGGPTPQTDWRPNDLSPDLSRSMATESLGAARHAICGVYGVLPALLNPSTTGPLVREAQRHLAAWVLQPVAELIAQEASEKLGAGVEIDVLRPLQAFDAGGRARAFVGMIEGFAAAKAAGLTPEQIKAALDFLDATPADYAS